jgi:SAM-dependent methyltransferase
MQAMFRGAQSRRTHVARARAGHKLICPFYASSHEVTRVMIDVAHISKDDVVFDLGSGDGSILIDIAKHTGAHCIGVDIDPLLCATARRRSKEAHVDHLTDFVCADISDISLFAPCSTTVVPTVICMFLVPSCLEELSCKLHEAFTHSHRADTASRTSAVEAQSASLRIVCYKYPLPATKGWVPTALIETVDVVNVNDPTSRSNVYFYSRL